MKPSYFVCAAAAFAAVVGGVSAWPGKIPPMAEIARLVPAKPIADAPDEPHPPELPPIVTGPNDSVIPASATVPQPRAVAELPQVPPPPMLPPPPAPPALPMVPPPAATPKLPNVPPPMIPLPAAPPMPAPLAPPQPLPNVPPPAPLGQPTPLVPPASPGVGSVVLLTDGKMVEGTVTLAGEKVLVRRGSIDQPFAQDQVQYIGKTKDDCYKHLLGKTKADDAPGRFKLARWCMYNGLREQALAEAKEVVKLQPNHALAAEMARTLEESIRLFNGDGTSKVPAADAPKPGWPALPKAVESDPEIAAEAAAAFAPRVQPVLVNLCADCHAKPGYAGAFKMACGSTQDMDPAIARQNLRATVNQIKKDDPGSSPLLMKSLMAHGGMKQAAFANRGVPAFRVLEAWVYLAAGSNAAPPAAPPVPPPDVKPTLPAVPAPDIKPALPPVPPPSVFGEDAKPKPPVVPASAGSVADEFDAAMFNQSVPAKPRVPTIPQLPMK